jgi:hypothetical protein
MLTDIELDKLSASVGILLDRSDRVHDPGVGRDRLGDLVGVARRRDAGTDVRELAHPRFPGKVADSAPEERADHRRNSKQRNARGSALLRAYPEKRPAGRATHLLLLSSRAFLLPAPLARPAPQIAFLILPAMNARPSRYG